MIFQCVWPKVIEIRGSAVDDAEAANYVLYELVSFWLSLFLILPNRFVYLIVLTYTVLYCIVLYYNHGRSTVGVAITAHIYLPIVFVIVVT